MYYTSNCTLFTKGRDKDIRKNNTINTIQTHEIITLWNITDGSRQQSRRVKAGTVTPSGHLSDHDQKTGQGALQPRICMHYAAPRYGEPACVSAVQDCNW